MCIRLIDPRRVLAAERGPTGPWVAVALTGVSVLLIGLAFVPDLAPRTRRGLVSWAFLIALGVGVWALRTVVVRRVAGRPRMPGPMPAASLTPRLPLLGPFALDPEWQVARVRHLRATLIDGLIRLTGFLGFAVLLRARVGLLFVAAGAVVWIVRAAREIRRHREERERIEALARQGCLVQGDHPGDVVLAGPEGGIDLGHDGWPLDLIRLPPPTVEHRTLH